MERAWSADEEAPDIQAASEPPYCLPGLNQQLVRKSWIEWRRRAVSEDGRLRLRGADTLDICAAPGETVRAIRQFARWLDYLASDGIGVEVRQLDGWRTCAMVDGEAVPIRLRERIRRVSTAEGHGGCISRWFRPAAQQESAPSGQLELQILRMGAAFATFPIGDVSEPSTFEAASRAIRATAKRNAEFERRMNAAAAAAGLKYAAERQEASRAGTSSAMPASTGMDIDPEILAALTALSALGNARLAQLLAAVERPAGDTGKAGMKRSQEITKVVQGHSLVRLARSITPDQKLQPETGGARALKAVSGSRGETEVPSPRRRARQAA